MSGSRQSHNSQAVGRKRDEDRTRSETQHYSSADLLLVLFLVSREQGEEVFCSPPTTGAAPAYQPPIFSSFKAAASLILQCSGTGKVSGGHHHRTAQSNLLFQATVFAYTYRHSRVHVLARNGFQIQKCQTGGHQNCWNEQLCLLYVIR